MTTHGTLFRPWPLGALLALAAVAGLRLASLGQVALTDNTESRYGAVAHEMARNGDWITPWTGVDVEIVRQKAAHYKGISPDRYANGDLIPYWGKPPLQFWLAAASYRALGVSEFAARLPSFLAAIVLVAATVWFAAGLWGRWVALLAGIILATSSEVFVLAGACELDMPLAASTSIAMIAFSQFVRRAGWQRTAWGLGFFLALALGALAKGPVALVLVGLTLGLWIVLARRWRLVGEMPWIIGTLLFLAVAAPWYLLAERATPGFLKYFLVNENFLRYLVNDYGDFYGYGRLKPYGFIWPFLLLALLPWTVLMVATGLRSAKADTARILAQFRWSRPWLALSAVARLPGNLAQTDPWLLYVLLWGLVPPLFFTAARQITLTYVLPGLPGLAIATAVGLQGWMQSDDAPELLKLLKWHVAALGYMAVAAAIVAAVFYGGRFGLAPGGVLAVAALSVLGIAALGLLAQAAARRRDAAALLTIVGLSAAVVLAAAMCLFRPWIDDRFSAKAIVAEVFHTDPAVRERIIAAPIGESTFSASFYVEVVYRGRFDHYAVPVKREKGKETEADDETARDLLARPEGELLLLKRSDWERLESRLGGRFALLAQTPYWVACQRR
jgi:4-amino-4-deoxy-L-arabinose transferase-like glycosyltransferase